MIAAMRIGKCISISIGGQRGNNCNNCNYRLEIFDRKTRLIPLTEPPIISGYDGIFLELFYDLNWIR